MEDSVLPTLSVLVPVVVAAILAWIGARTLASGPKPVQRALDETNGGLRKVHAVATPRVGGVAVAIGVAGGALACATLEGHAGRWLLLLACVSPAFVWGLIEDVSKRQAVLPRLVLPALGAALGFVLLDARLTELDIPLVDEFLAVNAVAFLFTAFAVTGTTHSVNVIDGLNGLAGVTSLLAAIGLAIVAAMVGDGFILHGSLVLAAAVAGFLLVNYPSGRIFLGDGGAYLIGLLLAELSVMLVQRNSEVSPWFPPVLLAFPIWETIFSMFRRRFRGHSTARADGLHLHQLIYRRVVRWRGFSRSPAHRTARNSIASLYLWVVPAVCLIVAVAFWDDSRMLQAIGVSYWIAYGLVYRTLVRFRVPRWLVVKVAEPLASLDEDRAGLRR